MKISFIPKKGRKDLVVYVNSRHGNIARKYVRPRNPRTAEQQALPALLDRACKGEL
jgi:hypothetical protein